MHSERLMSHRDRDLGRVFSQLARDELRSRHLELDSNAEAALDALIAQGVSELVAHGAVPDEIEQAKQNLSRIIQQAGSEGTGGEEAVPRPIQVSAQFIRSALNKLRPVFPFG